MTAYSFILLIGWIAWPIFWLLVLRLGGMRPNYISLPIFLIYFILIFQYIGYPILYLGLDEYRSEFVVNRELLIKGWLITSITTFLLCIGASLGAVVFGKLINNIENNNRNSKGINLVVSILPRIYFLSILGLVILVVYIYDFGISNLALVKAIQGEPVSQIILARSTMGNDYGAGYHWYSFMMKELLIFTALSLITMRLRGLDVSLLATSIIVLGVLFSLIMATEKGLIVDFIMAIGLVYLLQVKKGRIYFGGLMIVTFVVVLPLMIFYIFFMGDENLIAAMNSIISRAFTGGIQPIYHYLEFFPTHHDWLYGTSFPNPRGIFPFTSYHLTVEIMNFVHPEHSEAGIVGTMPTIYWGEIYANFGYYGLVFFPLFIGFVLYCINIAILRLKDRSINIALYAWILIHYKNLSITSISMFLLDTDLALILIAYLFCSLKFWK